MDEETEDQYAIVGLEEVLAEICSTLLVFRGVLAAICVRLGVTEEELAEEIARVLRYHAQQRNREAWARTQRRDDDERGH